MAQLTDQQKTFLIRYLGFRPTADSAGQRQSGELASKRSFLLTRWQRIPNELKAEVSGFAAEVRNKLPYEDADGFAKALEATLNELVEEMRDEVSDAVDADINNGDPKYGSTAKKIKELEGRVRGNGLIQALKSNSLMPGQPFEDAFLVALDEVGQKLTA